MIRVFPPTATDFTRGGVVLPAAACTVNEEANGMFDLEISMPCDARWRRHALLQRGNILYVQTSHKHVPIRHTIAKPGTVKLYRAVGVKIGKKTSNNIVTVEKRDPNTGAWYVEFVDKGTTSTVYSDVSVYQDEDCKTEIAKVENGERVTLIEEKTAAIFAMTRKGACGYIKKTQCAYVGEEAGDVIEIVDDNAYASAMQPLRIVEVTRQAPGTFSARAEHVYYDASYTTLPPISAVNMPLSELCAKISGRVHFTPGMTGYVTGDYDGATPVAIANDAAQQLDAQIVVDGWDAYFLPAQTTNVTVLLQTGARGNITDLQITEDATEIVTRFIPLLPGENGGDKTEGEPIDSPHIDEYPLVYIEHIEAATQAEAAEAAQKRFDKGCDLPKISVSVQAIPGALDNVSVFDSARVVDALTETDITGQISGVTTDACTGHITHIDIGDSKRRINASVFADVAGTWQKTTESR